MPKITLKRVTNVNGTSEELYPTTTLDQIISEGTGSNGADESLSAYLSSTYVPQSQKGAASGVATLDSDSKLTASQIPDYLLGGLYFQQSITGTGSLDEQVFATALHAAFTARDGDVDLDNMTGTYFIANSNFTIPTSSGHESTSGGSGTGVYWAWDTEQDFAEGTADGSDISVHQGDWIIIQGNNGGAGTDPQGGGSAYSFDISVINNTYRDASTSVKGIIQLSNAANAGLYNSSTNTGGLENGFNHAITESFLYSNMASGELNGGASGANNVLNKISSSNHIHDGRYYTESEIASFFSGNTSITGYNNSNWDTAYGDKIDSASFASNTGVLTLTRQDSGTVTVDLDGRYAESVAVAQTDSTDGLDVSVSGDTYTLKHHDTSSQASVNNSNGTVIQDITLDTFGHITSLGSYNLDNRYYTETEFNNWLDGTAIDGHNFTEIKYGASPSSTVVGTILIDVDA